MIITSSAPIRSAAICGDRRGGAFDRGPGRRVDREIEAGGKSHRAEDPEAVFVEPFVGVADRANQAGAQIADTTDEIDHAVVERIEEHAADREVAPARIFFDRAEVHRRGAAAVDIGRVGAEGRNLELIAGDEHHDHSEPGPDRDRFVEQLLHHLGTGISRDVVVLGVGPEDPIADASAGEVGLEAGFVKAVHDAQRLMFLFRGHRKQSTFRRRALSYASRSHASRGFPLGGAVRPSECVEQRHEDRNHHRSGEKADRPVSVEPARDAQKQRDSRQIRALPHRPGLDEVVDRGDRDRAPDYKPIAVLQPLA